MMQVLKIAIVLLFSFNYSYGQNTLYKQTFEEVILGSNQKPSYKIPTHSAFIGKVKQFFIKNQTIRTLFDTNQIKKIFRGQIEEISFNKTGYLSQYNLHFLQKYKNEMLEATINLNFYDGLLISKSFTGTLPNIDKNSYRLNLAYLKSMTGVFLNSSFKFNTEINVVHYDTLYLKNLPERNKRPNIVIYPALAPSFSDTINYVDFLFSTFYYSIDKFPTKFKEIIERCDMEQLKVLIHSPNLFIAIHALELINYLYNLQPKNKNCIINLQDNEMKLLSDFNNKKIAEGWIILPKISKITSHSIYYHEMEMSSIQKKYINTLSEE